MKKFTYNTAETKNENWRRWVMFRFGNNSDEMLDWKTEIEFEINGNSKGMSVSEANDLMKDFCFEE